METPLSNKSKFKSFEHQVAGHKGVMVDDDQLMVIKPSVAPEKLFYELAIPNTIFKQFIPEYYGVLKPHNGTAEVGQLSQDCEGSVGCTSPAKRSKTSTTEPLQGIVHGQEQEEYICIQNLLHGFAKPCVMDIKIGSRLYDDSADETKRQRMIKKALETTSSTLGFYVCGIKVQDPSSDASTSYDRPWCKSLTKITIRKAFSAFFPESLGKEFRNYLINQFVLELKEYRDVVKNQDLKMYSSSLLFVYDSGLNRRNAFFSKNNVSCDADTRKDSEVFINEDSEEEGDDAKKETDIALLDMRAIDFAHSSWTPGSKINTDYLEGLDKLIEILQLEIKN
ncbi:hypothetical protein H4219_004507 [Mycoemilia scoparia]|uniref:Kinase n=1 Tax=Mycoemilia scoparia TaxID=417184 RepID=A0A9W7ZY35_9FUNG|nr:hypothetical protein H4219_004507 [Mycoemilia scoparia]